MNELIKLAKEKGFKEWIEIPYIDNNDGRTYYFEPNNDDRCYYLWMCELQKWLMDEHEIYVTIPPEKCNIYKKYLEISLFKALKLIN